MDCGGPRCSPCVAGRGCLSSPDCDQAGSTTAGTAYPAGTAMVVCSSTSATPRGVCTDLRAATPAYPSGVQAPAGIGFTASLEGFPPALFTAEALRDVRAAVAGVLDAGVASKIQVCLGDIRLLCCLLASHSPSLVVQSSDLLVMSVALLPPSRRLATRRVALAVSNATGSSLLTMWLLLQPSFGVTASDALAKVNAPATQQDLVLAISAALQAFSPHAGINVSLTAASQVVLLSSVFETSPSNLGGAPSAPGAQLTPPSVAGLVAGLVLAVLILIVLWVVGHTRASGGKPPVLLGRCGGTVTQVASCCGRWPVRKRRPATSAQPGVVSWRDTSRLARLPPPAPVATTNPNQSILALRSVDAATAPSM